MFFATGSETSSGSQVLAVVALLICAGAVYLLAGRWGKALKARAAGEPRGQLTPGAWVVVAVVVVFFVVTVVLNLTGVW
jgi:uncharacterized membrane protein YidH (DUF202 family)